MSKLEETKGDNNIENGMKPSIGYGTILTLFVSIPILLFVFILYTLQ